MSFELDSWDVGYDHFLAAQRDLIMDRKKNWKQANGQWIGIKKMKTSHLQNTIAMLERDSVTHHPSYPYLKKELEKRKDHPNETTK